MHIRFYKYQGTGNDFILVDNRSKEVQLSSEAIIRLCDRKFGIGSDGLILIEPAVDSAFYMNFYNPDASQSFCGNGSRCAVAFAKRLGIVGDNGRFEAIDGEHDFTVDESVVRIHMKDVVKPKETGEQFVLDTGSPHYVHFVDDPDQMDLITEARNIRYSERFREKGINVNFVAENADGIRMRTYERGVEDETLSCGTGVTAAAIAFANRHPGIERVEVNTRGGQLSVLLAERIDHYENIWLCGPASLVFEGVIEL